MKCYEHQDIDATKNCEKCDKALCEKCVVEENNKFICKTCAETKSSSLKENDNFNHNEVIIENINTNYFQNDNKFYHNESENNNADNEENINAESNLSHTIKSEENSDSEVKTVNYKAHKTLTDEAIDKISFIKRKQVKIVLLIIWALFFIAAGIYLAISCNSYKTYYILLGFAIAGIIWTINGLKGHRHALNDKINALRSEIISFSFIQDNKGKFILIPCLYAIFFILKILFLFTLSLIIVPFKIVFNIVKFITLHKEKQQLEQQFI